MQQRECLRVLSGLEGCDRLLLALQEKRRVPASCFWMQSNCVNQAGQNRHTFNGSIYGIVCAVYEGWRMVLLLLVPRRMMFMLHLLHTT